MGYVTWYQRKIVWLAILTGTFILVIYRFCGQDATYKSFIKLKKTQDEINQLKKEFQTLKNGRLKDIDTNSPIIFLITPTYKRYTQQADLIRMSNTLKHVKNIHWIIIEDSTSKTDLVSSLLNASGLLYTHLNIRTQKDLVLGKNDPRWKKHRGLDQRNLALKWLRNRFDSSTNSVVYFADDDNTYHLDLFKEMRTTKKVSMWPVALVGGLLWEGPICKNNKVIKFHTAWRPDRSFPLDMAAFALNLKVVLEHPDAYFDPDSKRGWIETNFLTSLKIAMSDIEAKADNCMKILVWHTQTANPKMKDELRLQQAGKPSDPRISV